MEIRRYKIAPVAVGSDMCLRPAHESPVMTLSNDLVASSAASRPVLLLAGEKAYIDLLKHLLEKEAFNCLLADESNDIACLADTSRPNLIVLDSAIGRDSPMTVRRQLYSNDTTRRIPVIIMAYGFDEVDSTRCLKIEPTDYLLKPFPVVDLIRRINGMLCPVQLATEGGGVLSFLDIVMDLKAYQLFRNGREVHLGPIEFRILRHFMSNPCQVFSRQQLLQVVWGKDVHVVARTVDVHMARIRKALNEDGKPNYIRTVHAIGYSLDVGTQPL
ncbi:winged helix-turn-helix domain-containing protein [Bradyrhizobium sp. BR 1433]|uniref:winged helix-turn-helix domain-containing protein n=1 Tax=Bradyrhizobium sp. BR 1433 TaxID=3447967 RepID=UPI003EE49850